MVFRNAKSSNTSVSFMRTRGQAAIASGKRRPPKNPRNKSVSSRNTSDSPATKTNVLREISITENGSLNTGRWTKAERLAFLRGLRRYGMSKWKLIARGIATRDTTQTKTHAQSMLKTVRKGQNLFAELEEYERLMEAKENSRRLEFAAKDSELGNSNTKHPKTTSSTVKWRPNDIDVAIALLELKSSVESV